MQVNFALEAADAVKVQTSDVCPALLVEANDFILLIEGRQAEHRGLHQDCEHGDVTVSGRHRVCEFNNDTSNQVEHLHIPFSAALDAEGEVCAIFVLFAAVLSALPDDVIEVDRELTIAE